MKSFLESELQQKKLGKEVSILADLPGPKMRIGDLVNEFVTLNIGADFTLTAEEISGTVERAP